MEPVIAYGEADGGGAAFAAGRTAKKGVGPRRKPR
jgi:hypothetical protein